MIYVHEFINTRFTSFSTPKKKKKITNNILLKIYNFHLEIDYLYYLQTYTINFKSIYFYIKLSLTFRNLFTNTLLCVYLAKNVFIFCLSIFENMQTSNFFFFYHTFSIKTTKNYIYICK